MSHLNALRSLRINNINETLDAEGRQNKLEIANNKPYKEITNRNRLIVKLRQKKKST